MCRTLRLRQRLRPRRDSVGGLILTERKGEESMEIEMKDELGRTVERLAAAAGALEQAVGKLAQRQNHFSLDGEGLAGRGWANQGGPRAAGLAEKMRCGDT